MESLHNLITVMVTSIVDDVDNVSVESEETEKGLLFEVKVAKDDVGKVIGKQGRIATALRTVTKAAGAKLGQRVMVNVFNKPIE
jgi:hypothetical protein